MAKKKSTKRLSASERLKAAHAARGAPMLNQGKYHNDQRHAKKARKPEGMSDEQWAQVIVGKMCGAKLRNGGFCRKRPVLNQADIPGRTRPFRCLAHGGMNLGAPMGNKNALKHGFYSEALLEGENEYYDELGVSDLDEEIRMTKIRLRRLFIDERKQIELLRSENPELAMEPVQHIREIIKRDSEMSNDHYSQTSVRVVRELKTLGPLIHNVVMQLTRLMSQRLDIRAAESTGESAHDYAQRAREALRTIENEVWEQ